MPKSKYSEGLEGKRYSRLLIVSFSHSVKESKGNRYYWNCLCDCGNEHVADARTVHRGRTQSCGCLNSDPLCKAIKHGASRRGTTTREYTSWKKLKARIDNPNNEWFHRYGGRGIRYCKGFSDFGHFLNTTGPRPPGRTIDRINNNGHYSCGSCSECLENKWHMNVRWATIDEQNSNKHNTIFLTFNERRQALFLWAKEFGLSRHQLYAEYQKSETHAIAMLRSLT